MSDLRVSAILKRRPWVVRAERFALVGLPVSARAAGLAALSRLDAPFMQLITEPDLITLVVPVADWDAIAGTFPSGRTEAPFRVISFDIDLPPDLVGFLASISRALAGAGVPILAICGYDKDHILVREQHLAAALAALEALAE